MTSPHFDIRSVECTDSHAGWWSAPERTSTTQIVLVRRGRFRVRTDGRPSTVDPTTGYLHRPGQETTFAHPAGGDVCTAITVPSAALTSDIGPRPLPVRVDARLELAHRMLVRSGADPDFAAAETLVDLLQLAARSRPDERPAPGRHELAERAREAILAAEPDCGDLVSLAHLLESSPAHLSRTFRHHVGMPISRFRNRLRVSQALQRLEAGETDLAGLAVRLGFSDQAHMTRTMRQESGHRPGEVRTMLTGGRIRGCG